MRWYLGPNSADLRDPQTPQLRMGPPENHGEGYSARARVFRYREDLSLDRHSPHPQPNLVPSPLPLGAITSDDPRCVVTTASSSQGLGHIRHSPSTERGGRRERVHTSIHRVLCGMDRLPTRAAPIYSHDMRCVVMLTSLVALVAHTTGLAGIRIRRCHAARGM